MGDLPPFKGAGGAAGVRWGSFPHRVIPSEVEECPHFNPLRRRGTKGVGTILKMSFRAAEERGVSRNLYRIFLKSRHSVPRPFLNVISSLSRNLYLISTPSIGGGLRGWTTCPLSRGRVARTRQVGVIPKSLRIGKPRFSISAPNLPHSYGFVSDKTTAKTN